MRRGDRSWVVLRRRPTRRHQGNHRMTIKTVTKRFTSGRRIRFTRSSLVSHRECGRPEDQYPMRIKNV